jgi:hypothetical protein
MTSASAYLGDLQPIGVGSGLFPSRLRNPVAGADAGFSSLPLST